MCASAQDVKDDAPMVYIPAGEFTMGTSKEEAKELGEKYGIHPSYFLTETPKRTVNVKGFLIDKYPVTNKQYKKFIDATKHRPPRGWQNRTYPAGMGDHPVTNMFWQDADAYAKWAGKRLPTAEEWEKAARGTDGRQFPWGHEWNDEAARTDDPSAPQTRALTTPVGCFPKGASPYGVMDLCGNVAEWTGTPSRPSNPERGWAWYVIKGAGGAHGLKANFRCAAVNFSAHTSRAHPWLGFRCAKDCAAPPTDLPEDKTPARTPPPIPPAKGPDPEKYGKEPIRIQVAKGWANAAFEVPYFPEARFSLFCPEQSGAKGVPLSWKGGRPKIKWIVNEDHTEASYQCTFEGKAVQTITLKSGMDYVDYTIALKNLTDKTFTGVGTNSCFNNSGAVYFANMERTRSFVWTDDGATCMLQMPIGGKGEPLHGGWAVAKPEEKAPKGGSKVRYPFIFIVSRDGGWTIAQAYGEGISVATNAHYSCLHSRPAWPDIPPGEERSVTGKMYFIKGGPQDLFERWKKDFQKP